MLLLIFDMLYGFRLCFFVSMILELQYKLEFLLVFPYFNFFVPCRHFFVLIYFVVVLDYLKPPFHKLHVVFYFYLLLNSITA